MTMSAYFVPVGTVLARLPGHGLVLQLRVLPDHDDAAGFDERRGPHHADFFGCVNRSSGFAAAGISPARRPPTRVRAAGVIPNSTRYCRRAMCP